MERERVRMVVVRGRAAESELAERRAVGLDRQRS